MDRTLRPFLLRPGFLTREFNQGRRAQYSAPFRLYLLTSLLLFFSIGIQRQVGALNEDPASHQAASSSSRGQGVEFDLGDEERIREFLGEDSWVYRAWTRKRSRFESLPEEEQLELVVTSALSQMPSMLLLMLPVSALLLRLVFLRTGHVFGEHFVFVLHVHAFHCLALLLPTFVSHWSAWAVVGIAIPTYFLLALHRAYDTSPSGTLWRALLVSPFYLATFLPVLLSLVFLSVFKA